MPKKPNEYRYNVNNFRFSQLVVSGTAIGINLKLLISVENPVAVIFAILTLALMIVIHTMLIASIIPSVREKY